MKPLLSCNKSIIIGPSVKINDLYVEKTSYKEKKKMKSYEELLSDIEEDMETIVYWTSYPDHDFNCITDYIGLRSRNTVLDRVLRASRIY